MSDETRQIVQSYLQAPTGAFWKWSDHQTISWSKGWTIAFRPELERALSAIAETGDSAHPPMGAVVLVLAACRSVWTQENGGRQALLDYAASEGAENSPVLHRVLKGLDAINALPPERTAVEAKASVVGSLFETYAGHSQTSRAIMEQLRIGLTGLDVMRPRAVAHPEYEFVLVLAALDNALSKCDPANLGLRKQTGLDKLPQPAPLDEALQLPASVRVRQLIDDLRTDDQLANLIRLTRDVVAAIQLPRPVSAPDNLSTGGVSDITNRGTLDRLLTSELVHDSLTLAVRVAVGEALYLRREFFPQTAKRHRYLLLDSGIRLWGVPRIFAAAVGMGLSATTSPKDELHVFRATDDDAAPVDLTIRAGLIDHLTRLEPAPHPGGSLPGFLAKVRGAAGDVEAILVTHSETLADPDFLAATAALGSDSLYIAAINSTGRLQILQLTHAGRRVIKEVTLKLEDLFANPPDFDTPAKPATLLVSNDGLPAIFSERSFPLLLPEQNDTACVAQNDRFGTVSARGRSVIHWASNNKGARRLPADLPEGRLLWMGLDDAGVVRALVGPANRAPLKLFSYNLTNDVENVIVLPLESDGDLSAWATVDVLCVISNQTAFAFSLVDGREAARLHLSGTQGQGRFFKLPIGWHAVSYAAGVLQIDRVAADDPNLAAVFETKSLPCVGLKRDGTFISLPDEAVIHTVDLMGFASIAQVVAVASESERLAIRLIRNASEGVILRSLSPASRHLRSPLPTYPRKNWGRAWIDFNRPQAQIRSLLHRFVAIEPLESGLVLRSVRETQWSIGLTTTRGELFFSNIQKAVEKSIKAVTFKDVQTPLFPRHVSLRVATFADGSRAFLDSRGLLHLISSDVSLPQITLTLVQTSAIAGWISDGRTFGDPYFFADKTTATGNDAAAIIRLFIRRLR